MHSKKILMPVVLAALGAASVAQALDVGSSTTVGGLAYLDFSDIQQKQNGLDYPVPPPAATAPVTGSGVGFDVKRAYLIVDHKFDSVWAANITTDAQYDTNSKVGEIFIKKFYLQATLSDALVLHAGSYDNPWIPFAEAQYGYRYVEKLTLDRLGYGNTTDWGVSASGQFAHNLVNYAIAVINGNGYKNPSRSKYVDEEMRVGINPVNWLTIGLGYYNGHLGQVTQSSADYARNTASRLDLLLAVHWKGLRVGGEYFEAKNFKLGSATTGALGADIVATNAVVANGVVTNPGTAPVSDEAAGYSGWASYNFTPQWAVFGRYDTTKPSKHVDTGLQDTFYNLGVAFKPIPPIDLALVYKNERVTDGVVSISGGDAGSAYTIGGINAKTDGSYEEIGLYAQFRY